MSRAYTGVLPIVHRVERVKEYDPEAVAELIEAATDICYEVSDRSDGKRALIKALDRVKGGE
jgi:hypothetical protein